MEKATPNTVQVGDWVSGFSFNDEVIRGYVESIDREIGKVKVQVFESDNEAIVGHTAEASIRRVRLLPDKAPDDEATLTQLIDLALASKDEAWFKELTSRLLTLRAAPGGSDAGKRIAVSPSRRW